MILREIVTTRMLELLLITISAYVAAKTYGTRASSRITKAFSAFASANMIFQFLDFCMELNRSSVCFNGFAVGSFIYVVTLTAMAGTGYHWFMYVEEAIGSETFNSRKNMYLWSIPLVIFSLLCIVSIRTGWIFTFDAGGKYKIGSLFILQYVVIFGYCLLAMFRSAANFFVKRDKRATDRTLFLIMLIDTVAVMIQLSFMVNMMNTALVLTVLLSYMTVYSSEIERIKLSLEKERLLSRKQENESLALAENNARFFALEDDFMSLYDVEMESGHYVSYDRDEFYKRNVSDNVVSQTEFFKDLRTNVERVVFEEDREAVYQVQTRENILQALSRKDHIDHYYRIITENGLMWLKMRIVYKNAEKKNIIVGVFNAEEEMAVRQKEEQFREELLQTNTRLFALEDSFESLYDVELETGHYDVDTGQPARSTYHGKYDIRSGSAR